MPWVKTGVMLGNGDEVVVQASGRAATVPEQFSGPDGQPYRCDSTCSFPGGWFGQLIAKIGVDGQPIAVGEKSTLIADDDGELFLGVNDCCDWSDNQGELKVTVAFEKK